MLILTHNYPADSKDSSGIWIQRLWDPDKRMQVGREIILMTIEKGFYKSIRKLFSTCSGLWKSFMKLRRSDQLIIAYWIFPAGILAWFSRRKYILNCVGLDVFIICRSPFLSWLVRPILNRAEALVFIGGHPMNVLRARYGDRYADKMHLIYLPVSAEEFFPQ